MIAANDVVTSFPARRPNKQVATFKFKTNTHELVVRVHAFENLNLGKD